MSFFGTPSEGNDDLAPREPPEWIGPPPRAVPGAVDAQVVLVETDQVVIVAAPILAYGTGLEVWLRVFSSNGREVPLAQLQGAGFRPAEADECLQLGVKYPDGRIATNQERITTDRPAGPVLIWRQGWSQGGGQAEARYWLWPLPEAGALTFVTAWPSRKVPEQSQSIDTGALREAAARSRAI